MQIILPGCHSIEAVVQLALWKFSQLSVSNAGERGASPESGRRCGSPKAAQLKPASKFTSRWSLFQVYGRLPRFPLAGAAFRGSCSPWPWGNVSSTMAMVGLLLFTTPFSRLAPRLLLCQFRQRLGSVRAANKEDFCAVLTGPCQASSFSGIIVFVRLANDQ